MPNKPINRKKILVVEDEKSLVNAIRIKLGLMGFEVLTASTVENARKLIDESDDLSAVWLDHYLLGTETGLDLIQYLRDNEKDFGIKVFVVSSSVTDSKINTYLNMGAAKYYSKHNHRLEDIIDDIKKTLHK